MMRLETEFYLNKLWNQIHVWERVVSYYDYLFISDRIENMYYDVNYIERMFLTYNSRNVIRNNSWRPFVS
jgi:hypothetical protein